MLTNVVITKLNRFLNVIADSVFYLLGKVANGETIRLSMQPMIYTEHGVQIYDRRRKFECEA